ncbi:family 20 glycosylhydrolase [Ferrimonas gelatinilytica]|uniref:beta-N-acetylhexosaminidase n=1 Tax=Ferrimonas gelatinilytica TaxID=1255257 RepID=A0ABP9S4E6_9GAMM
MLLRAAFCSGLLLLAGCQQASEPTSDSTLSAAQVADQLSIQYQVLDNQPDEGCDPGKADGHCYRVRLSLTPETHPLPATGWSIVLSQVSYIQGIEGPLELTHINGDLHRLSPGPGFTGLAPGEQLDLELRANFWSVSEFDAIPNYLLEWRDDPAVVIASTREQRDAETGLWQLPHVVPMTDREQQLKRTDQDNVPLADAAQLYARYQELTSRSEAASKAPEFGLIPTPVSLTPSEGESLPLSRGWTLTSNDFHHLDAALDRLSLLGFEPSEQGSAILLERAADLPESAYRLSIDSDGIRILASSDSGAFYGLQSLAGLIRLGRDTLPAVEIEDAPRYPYRGLHLDLARNFVASSELETLMDQMAAYKLNKLHLHLADDEGWRLAIPGLPELTEIGAYRCADLSEQDCLQPQLGAGTERNSPVNGYFSRERFIELLRYAQARHIEVIPSLDMPGHARAAVVAMERRFEALSAAGQAEAANQYRLLDPTDTTEYLSIQYYRDNTLNPCIDSSYAFIGKVLDEVKAMYDEAGVALPLYHIGADETEKAWYASPACAALIASTPELDNLHQLTGYFLKRVTAQLKERGIAAGGWSDGLEEAASQLEGGITSYAWGVLAWEGHHQVHRQLKRGWDVVLSTPDALYLDFPYVADPLETGYYWGARQIDSHKVFSLQPDNLPVHAEYWLDRMGNPFVAADPEPLAGERILGIQAQLWTETVRDPELVHYKLFPRLLAVAERAWHRAEWELDYRPGQSYGPDTDQFTEKDALKGDWQRFAHLLGQQELAKLDRAGIFYRIPTVGAQIRNGQLEALGLYPGLALEYRTEGGQWQPFDQPVAVKGQVAVRARSADGLRPGRSLTLEAEGPQRLAQGAQ